MRVRSGDTVHVLDTSGKQTTGTFARASVSSIALLVDGQPREIPVSEVQQVARRGNRSGMGALAGAAVGAVGGVINGRYGDGECRRGPVGCAITAVGPGAIIGRLIPQRTIVYRKADSAAAAASRLNFAVSSVVSRRRKAVGIAVRF